VEEGFFWLGGDFECTRNGTRPQTTRRMDDILQVRVFFIVLVVIRRSSVFNLAIAQHEEKTYVEVARIFERFVRVQSKVRISPILVCSHFFLRKFSIKLEEN
jgi:hypothetical protein